MPVVNPKKLSKFIQQYLEQGHSLELIKREALKQGFTEADLAAAIGLLKHKAHAQKIHIAWGKIFLGLLFSLLVVGGLWGMMDVREESLADASFEQRVLSFDATNNLLYDFKSLEVDWSPEMLAQARQQGVAPTIDINQARKIIVDSRTTLEAFSALDFQKPYFHIEPGTDLDFLNDFITLQHLFFRLSVYAYKDTILLGQLLVYSDFLSKLPLSRPTADQVGLYQDGWGSVQTIIDEGLGRIRFSASQLEALAGYESNLDEGIDPLWNSIIRQDYQIYKQQILELDTTLEPPEGFIKTPYHYKPHKTLQDFFIPLTAKRLENVDQVCADLGQFESWFEDFKTPYQWVSSSWISTPNVTGRLVAGKIEGFKNKGLTDCVLQLRSDFLQTSVALQRYHLEHGTFPVDLEALVPEFLDAVPVDPFFPRYKIGYKPDKKQLESIGIGNLEGDDVLGLNQSFKIPDHFKGTFIWNFYEPPAPLTTDIPKPKIRISRPR